MPRKPTESSRRSDPDGDSQAALNVALAQKARVETRVAAKSLTRNSRVRETLVGLASSASLLVALATAVGGGFTIYRWVDDRASEREFRAEERLTAVLAKLTSKESSERMAAVAAIGLYVDREHPLRNKQIMLALATAVSLEVDPFVQQAMIELIGSLDFNAIDQAISSGMLNTILKYDRAMTSQAQLYSYDELHASDDDRRLVRRLLALSRLIRVLLAAGAQATDFSGTFLPDVSFAGLSLQGADFSGAILAYSNFANADLTRAIFSNANLEGVSFIGAKLAFSKFDYSDPVRGLKGYYNHSHYYRSVKTSSYDEYMKELAKSSRVRVLLPDFRHADLRYSVMRRLPILFYSEDYYSGISFADADLRCAELDPIFLKKGKEATPKGFSGTLWRAGGQGAEAVWVIEPDGYGEEQDELFSEVVDSVWFGGVQAAGLKMKPWFSKVLVEGRGMPSTAGGGQCSKAKRDGR